MFALHVGKLGGFVAGLWWSALAFGGVCFLVDNVWRLVGLYGNAWSNLVGFRQGSKLCFRFPKTLARGTGSRPNLPP